jgi:hypothetical protein
MQTIRNDDTISPVPENFTSPEDYSHWQQQMRRSFQEIILKLLKYRFISPPDPRSQRYQPLKIRLTVVQAKDLVGKEGRARSAYCNIEYGDFGNKIKKREEFRTEVVADSLEPLWNQSMTIEVTSANDEIQIHVVDSAKDHFLGEVVIVLDDIAKECRRNGMFEKWKILQQRVGKSKDKYVGGRLLLRATLVEERSRRVHFWFNL